MLALAVAVVALHPVEVHAAPSAAVTPRMVLVSLPPSPHKSSMHSVRQQCAYLQLTCCTCMMLNHVQEGLTLQRSPLQGYRLPNRGIAALIGLAAAGIPYVAYTWYQAPSTKVCVCAHHRQRVSGLLQLQPHNLCHTHSLPGMISFSSEIDQHMCATSVYVLCHACGI